VALAGGTEACVNRLTLAGFARARALSTKFNETPAGASRPWNVDRDG
jgi:3-oxoacyl-[acyl-carrier-protein] synthase II